MFLKGDGNQVFLGSTSSVLHQGNCTLSCIREISNKTGREGAQLLAAVSAVRKNSGSLR